MSYTDVKEMLRDARSFASGANDHRTVSLLKDIQLEVYDLLDENRELRLENDYLKNKEIDKSKVEWKGHAYYPKDGSENIYCPRCFDKDGLLLNMIKIIPAYSKVYSAKCPECNTAVKTKETHGRNW